MEDIGVTQNVEPPILLFHVFHESFMHERMQVDHGTWSAKTLSEMFLEYRGAKFQNGHSLLAWNSAKSAMKSESQSHTVS